MSPVPGRPVLRHGSCVAMEGRGVLILGASGSGKSSLALELIGCGADLVADDQVWLSPCGAGLLAYAPDTLVGLIEVRNIGILRLRPASPARLVLAVDLDHLAETRLPQLRQICITDLCLPLIEGKSHPNLGSVVMAILRAGADDPFLDPERGLNAVGGGSTRKDT